jgi:hypothetical protein
MAFMTLSDLSKDLMKRSPKTSAMSLVCETAPETSPPLDLIAVSIAESVDKVTNRNR